MDYQLTKPQNSIWLTEKFFNGTSVNNICGYVYIKNEVDFNALKKALNELVKTNDSMRFKFKEENGSCIQYVNEYKEFNIEIIELSSEKEIENEALKFANILMDIENNFLFKIVLFKLPNNSGGFIINVHHIIGDSWTLGLIAKETTNIYSNILNSTYEEKPFPSYINYVNNEIEYINSEKYIKDKEYWNEIFKTIPEVASIPSTKEVFSKNISCEGNREKFIISEKQINEIKDFCTKNKISVYNFFMAAYSLYLGRVSNLDDFVIGTPILNRTNFEQKHTMGMFINTAPLRINLDHNLSFTNFTKQISSNSMSLLRHQRYPYQAILEDLRKKDSSIPNLYNVILSYQITKTVEEENNIKYTTDWVFNGNSADDLQIHLFDLNDEASITVAYDYKSNKYEVEDIKNLHNRILTIINQVILNNDILLRNIEIVTPEEKHKILYEFNNTKVEYPKDKTVVDLFEEQVEKTPDSIAVEFENIKISYKDLLIRVNKLSNYLQNQNLSNEKNIGIFTNRTIDTIVGILSILKIGATFVPIDPLYPIDRINHMIASSNLQFILTDLDNTISLSSNVSTININYSKYSNLSESYKNKSITTSQNLYIIFTSGSTGTPKGLGLSHKNMVNLISFEKDSTDFLSANNKILQFATMSFDVSYQEIFSSLLSGCTLVLIDDIKRKNIDLLVEYIFNHKITTLFIPPAYLRLLVEDEKNIDLLCKTIKYIITAGESLLISRGIKKLLEKDIKLFNHYGPAETHVATTYLVPKTIQSSVAPIGKPIYNSHIYILDANNNLCPNNVAGQIAISGDCVGNGYINNKELNKERFIPDLFDSSKTMYLTGDIGFINNNNIIHYIGRNDFQVKINGFRIEPDEVNKNILEHNGITSSCTIVKEHNSKKYIISYYTTNKDISSEELNMFLSKKLAKYMMPYKLIKLNALPININGKIDKKALPDVNFNTNENFHTADTETEKKLLNLWKNILKITNISIDNDFFTLGGDSLLGIKLISYINKEFDINISINDLFNNSTIHTLGKLLDDLSNKKEIYSNTISKAEKQEYYPLSSAQKRMYYSSSLDNNSTLYNIAGGIIVDKILDINKLQECFNTLINKHEALRTHFDIKNNEVVQIIDDNINFELTLDNANTDDLNKIYTDFVKHFDLSKAPLFRTKLVKLENHQMLILLDMHHIISDGTSLGILLQELCDLYNESELTEKQIDYKDFTLWEKEQFESKEFKKSKEYWVNQFKDEIPLLNMPIINPRPSVQSFEGSNYHTKLSAEVFDKVNEVSKKLNITPYMLMLSCYYILLSKYTSQDDIVVGTPIVGRELPELSNMLGMFVNTLAMRNTVQHKLSFKEFSKNIKENCLNGFKNQIYPFDMLVKELKINRDTSRNPLFDVMFVYQNNGYPEINFKDTKTEYFIPDNNISKFDLTLEVLPINNEYDLRFEYCTKLFDEEFIKRFSMHYINILNTILDNNDIKIANIDMLSLEEKSQILYEFNNTKVDYPKDKTIVDLFEEQVEKTPDNIAVVFEDQKLTYRELNERANQLARYLIHLDIPDFSNIGILLKRSIDIYVCILGILKSNHNYMLIDYNLPKDRIEYMLNNSNSSLLLTSTAINNALTFNKIVYVDKINYNLDNKNIKKEIFPRSISCIIYTSGSTGIPKGVMLTHQGIVNMFISYKNILHIDKLNTFLSMSTVSFDMFTVETFIPLLSGGTIILTNDKEQQSPQSLENLILHNSVDFILTTPSKIELLMINKNCLKNIKTIQLGGEIFTPSLYKKLRKFTNANIYNGYGPTEITACCSSKKVVNSNISIGTPFCNTKIFICDKSLNLLPIGVAGELCVSGDGIALGYINNEKLTNNSFVLTNFCDTLVYKTGDLAYFDFSGELHYLKRIDNQVKLRGLRIELDEISTRIKEINGVKNSITLIKEINGNKSICSYISLDNSVVLSDKVIKKYLEKYLPNYMIPNFIMFIDKMPLTLNGKIDIIRLPEIKINNKKINIASTRNEKILSAICKKYLSVDSIDICTNLFEIGADSLFSIKFVGEIYNNFKINISVKDIFEHPTIKTLSDYISTLTKKRSISNIKKAEKQEYYPLSSAQKRMYYSSNLDNNSTLYNIAGGIIVDKLLDINKLQECFNSLINRHEALRTRFDIVADEVVQIIVDDIDFDLTLDNANTDDLNKIYTDFVKPFDLSKAPLFRTKLVKLQDEKMLLLLDMHHIISDGTSLGILLQELCDLYNESELTEKQIDYKDFTSWEKEQFESEEFKKSKEYWLSNFKDEIPLLNMPTINPRPSVQSFEGSNYHTKLSKKIFDKVNEVAKKLNITPYMLMLSTYYILLSKYTSQDDIVVGTPIVGRELPELSNMLGMFVNTLAMRNKIEASLSFEEFSKIIKENCLNNFKNQIYPFDMLVKDLNIKRDTSRSPLFDVMFIYQNNGYPEINFKNTKTEYFVPDNKVSKFDLSLEVLPINNEYDLRFEYCTKLFDEDFIKRFSMHYINILNTILENTEIKIADIDILSEEEKNQILYEFNNTKVDYPKDKTIVDLFEEQVEKTPNNIAIVFEGQKLTYRELNEKANQLARYLIENGVTNNSIVGIMVPRSLEMIIAMFGILKSGAAYLPLDPTYPKNRIKYILKDSNVNLLLTKDSTISLDNINETNINISTSNIYNKYSKHNLNNIFSSSNLAYVIYTSGSTGNPKGVSITHQNVNNFIKGVVSEIKFNDVIVSVTTICFDIFVLESILPLQNGLTIIIANESEQTVPQLLNKLCIKNNVSMIQTTPSKFSLLISDEDSLEFLKNIKTIMLGGEPFPYKLLLKIRDLTNCKIYNMYGPTETTVWSSIKDLTKSDNITIGTPIANTSMYVLDNNLSILPLGIPGTLYIGGDGVSNGYLNKEDLTSKKFISNPFNTSEKIYNTGDLAKWTTNGELICLGRSDFQVKIRGLRIELEEIEKAILTFNNIKNAIVTVNSDSLSRQVLCAYFVSNVRVSISELKQYLSMFLPNYMLPTYIIQLDDFKYTPNGKIDKKALPDPDLTTERKRIIMPKTDTECKILKIWEDLLCISPISISDNFFEIGGDSLLALKMQIELLKQNINVTYAEIFKYNTIKKLSSLVDKKSNISDSNLDIYASYDYSNINSVLYNNNISNLDDIKYKPIENVLLTGVTGFLGAHILDYLMKNTNIKVYCLVRKDPSVTLIDKVLSKLHFYFGNVYDELINKRIFIVNSDLTQDKLGLTDEKILSLSSKISCVINSAALVKHYGDYNEFEAVNVISVKKLIDFCKKYNKKLVQISTISVSSNTVTDFANNIDNFSSDINFGETNLYVGQSMENVYVRSKFEAEKMILEEIGKNKLDALILRIGNITNRLSDGKFQSNPNENAFANKIKAFIEIGSLPDYILDKYVEFSPVDAVAEAVVKSIEYSNTKLSVLHIYNHNHVYLNEFIKLLPKKYKFNSVSDLEFKNIIKNMLKNDDKKYIISHILNDLNSEDKLVYDTHIKIKSNFSQEFFKKIGFLWPNINQKYIENLLKNI